MTQDDANQSPAKPRKGLFAFARNGASWLFDQKHFQIKLLSGTVAGIVVIIFLAGAFLLVTYRNQLLEAVRRRDANAVAALVDPKIRMSFGGDAGVEALKQTLAREGGFEELEFVLTHGGSFIEGSEKRAFWAPYVYSKWPDDRDSFSDFAITEENVPLRESRDANSPVIATLSYDVVTQVMHEGNLRQVKTADGKTGWVDANKTRSPIAYRAGFNKSAGQWKLNALVAGD